MNEGSVSSRAPRRPVLILGATSAIAKAVATELCRRGFDLLLAGRDRDALDASAADLRLRFGASATPLLVDALDFDSHPAFFDRCLEASGPDLAGVVLCIGYLGDQSAAQSRFSEARRILDTNLLAPISLLNLAANHFETRREGFLCAVSSVAGDRGRASNYIYGCSKAGLNVYLQGLRNRLAKAGVRVLTIKPGFVDTPMTLGRSGMFLVASPETVGRRIVAALLRGRDEAYVPGFWRPLMFLIRSIPERVFKRMRL